MNSQMTALALGLKCGLPSGRASLELARATPSPCSSEARASPVKPMPVSARKLRRVIPGQDNLVLAMDNSSITASAELLSSTSRRIGGTLVGRVEAPLLSHGYKIVMIQEHEHQVLPGTKPGFGGRRGAGITCRLGTIA